MIVVPIACEEVWREISNYLENDLDGGLRARMEAHFQECKRCQAVLDGTRNVATLVGDDRAFDIPQGFGKRLFDRLQSHLHAHDITEIPLGITNDLVPLGSHLIYFWETDEEFARGVRFLEPGFDAGEHGILFGHEEALERALGVLRTSGHDVERLIEARRLTVLRRHKNADATLSDIAAVAQSAQRAGARAIRFLGNLGMGRDPLPAGEDDVLQLESGASALIANLPCVIVCMYDVRTLPGRLILKGGLETHRLTVCTDGVRENPYYRASRGSWPHLEHLQ